MISALRAAWRAHRGLFVALLSAPIALAVAWWATELRPRARWTESGSGSSLFEFTPDGRSILSQSGDGIQLRDVATGRVRATIVEPTKGNPDENSHEEVHFEGFTPDGRSWIGEFWGGREGDLLRLKVWDLATGRERADLGPIHTTSTDIDRPYYGNHVRSADGKVVAFAPDLEAGPPTVDVWEVERTKKVATFPRCLPLALSPDGKTLVVRDSEGGPQPPENMPMVRVREVATGRETYAFASRWPTPRCPASISPGGTLLALTMGEEVAVWDLENRREVFVGGQADVDEWDQQWTPWFSPDGTLLFPSGIPHESLTTPCLDLTTSPPRWVSDSAVPPQGRRFYTADARGVVVVGHEPGFNQGFVPRKPVPKSSRLLFLDYPSGRLRASFQVRRFQQGIISPDGRTMYVMLSRLKSPFFSLLASRLFPARRRASEVINEAILMDLYTGKHRGAAEYNGWGSAIFSPSGDMFAIRQPEAGGVEAEDPENHPRAVEVWDVPIRSPAWGVAIALLAAVAPPGLGWLARSRRGRGLDSGSGVG